MANNSFGLATKSFTASLSPPLWVLHRKKRGVHFKWRVACPIAYLVQAFRSLPCVIFVVQYLRCRRQCSGSYLAWLADMRREEGAAGRRLFPLVGSIHFSRIWSLSFLVSASYSGPLSFGVPFLSFYNDQHGNGRIIDLHNISTDSDASHHWWHASFFMRHLSDLILPSFLCPLVCLSHHLSLPSFISPGSHSLKVTLCYWMWSTSESIRFLFPYCL